MRVVKPKDYSVTVVFGYIIQHRYRIMASFSEMGSAMSGNSTDFVPPPYICSSTSEESDCGLSGDECHTTALEEDRQMLGKKRRENKKKPKGTGHGEPSGQKRKGDEDYEMRAPKKVEKMEMEGTRCKDEEDKSRESVPVSGVDTHDETLWDIYCNLPVFPDGSRQKSKRRGYVVSLDDNMVYYGPIYDSQRQLLTFKARVLCDIVKDPHSPKFHVSDDVLMFPLCNPGMLAKWKSGEVYEVFQATRLASQSKHVLGTQPVSILEHCLLRYILDIGDTGLSHMRLQGKTQTFINWHLDKPWGNTSLNCKDPLVQFFENHMAAENSLLVMRCMVLQHKASLLKFLTELDTQAIELAAARYEICQDFVNDMKVRMNRVHSVLSDFETKNLLVF